MAAGNVERIQVVFQAIMRGFGRGVDKVNSKLQIAGKNMSNFGQVMGAPMKKFKEINGSFKEMHTSGGRLAHRMRLLTHGMRGFRMEALGVMFFGMMLQRMFMGLLRPIMDTFGVFDLLSTTLMIVFLPIMEAIFPYLLSFMEFFMNLPDPVKKVIGALVVIGAIVGTLLMYFGAFALGIGSLIQMFPGFGIALKTAGAFIAKFGLMILGVIALIIIVIVGMVMAWKENFMGMKEVVTNFVNAVKGVFIALWQIITSIVRFFIAVFTGDWAAAGEHLKNIFKGLVDFINNLWAISVEFIKMVIIGIVWVVKWVVEKIVSFFTWLWDKLVGHSIIPDMIKAMIAWFWKLPKAVFDMLASIVKKMFSLGKDLIQSLIDGIVAMGRKVLDAILGLFPEWMRNGIEASGTIVINIIKKIKETITGGGGGAPDHNDFIWRSGQDPISFNKKDTLVGFKGSAPDLGSGGGITQENNFYGFTMDDLKRELDDRDRRLVAAIGRNI